MRPILIWLRWDTKLFSDQLKGSNRQKLHGIEKHKSVKKVFDFIEQCLPHFKESCRAIQPEDGLT